LGSYQVVQGDFNGDGIQDFALVNGNHYFLFLAKGPMPDLVSTIQQGVGLGAVVTINYKPLPQMAATGDYVKELSLTYPKAAITPPMVVVSSTSMANGVGGTHDVTYRYGTAVAEQGAGRGFLGFNWTEHTDVPSGLISRTYFRQDWPYLGQVDRTAEYTSGAIWTGSAAGTPSLSNPGGYYKEQINTYSCLDISNPTASPLPSCSVGPGKRYFVYASQVDAMEQDLDGTALPGKRTSQTMDGWGNPLTVTETVLDASGAATGYTKTTTNTYSNDTANWFLGRLLRSSVSAQAPVTP
jgi:hypothetical protein